jgi:hypothetical protein
VGGLPNILAQRFVVPEFLQEDATPENLARAALNLYDDSVTRNRMEALFAGFAASLKAIPAGSRPRRWAANCARRACDADRRRRRGGTRSAGRAGVRGGGDPRPETADRGLRDSKQLSAAARERLAIEIRASAIAWYVAWADVSEIDSINILQATLLAMQRAVVGSRSRRTGRGRRQPMPEARVPHAHYRQGRLHGAGDLGRIDPRQDLS